MKSKITISMDYVAKTPFIKIQHEHSDDERDIMIREFLSSMGGDVCFAKFQYENNCPGPTPTTAGIRPIPYLNLKEEVKTMQVWIDYVESNILESPKFLNIHIAAI